MLVNQRIIWQDDTTLKDMSVELNDLTAGSYTIPLVAADDKIYIGSDLPFNHRYFNVSVVNAVASVCSVEIWDGNNWVAAVDVLDETSTSGATLAKSGIISWTTDRSKAWGIEDTTENVEGLTSLKIYNMYWVRLAFSANFTASTALKYIGHKFAKDADLVPAGYPDLNSSDVKTAFETGKTNWDDQHISAAEEIVRYLQQKNYIRSGNQIFDWRTFNTAAVHKLAEILYSSFGADYEERRKLAESKYYKAMNTGGIYKLDRDEDGHSDVRERYRFQGIRRR